MKRSIAVAFLRNTRKTPAVPSAPPKGRATFFHSLAARSRVLCALLMFGALAHSSLHAGQKGMNSDDRISDQVRMKLATDPDVKGGALEVVVKDGVVVMKGRVDSDKGKSKATHLAKKIKGVKDVDNELVVGPPTN